MSTLAHYHALGFTIELRRGDVLGVSPATLLTDEIKAALRRDKPLLLAELKARRRDTKPLKVSEPRPAQFLRRALVPRRLGVRTAGAPGEPQNWLTYDYDSGEPVMRAETLEGLAAFYGVVLQESTTAH